MKPNNLNKSLFIATAAALMLTASAAAFAQTSLSQEGETAQPEMTMTTPEAPIVPTTPTVNVPSTMPAMPAVTSSASSGGSSDPAVSAVLDRLKQDSTPLSISDMSAAQDALARLNLLNEIEQKLSQIEETRQKRQFGSFSSMGAMPMTGMPVMESAAGYPPMGNPAAFASTSTSSEGPEIVSITGAGGVYKASLNIDGRIVNAKSGTVLPDGSKVTNISASGVSVSKKGKTSKLSFMQQAAE